jgi:predicted MFS family arabinose efflux permease
MVVARLGRRRIISLGLVLLASMVAQSFGRFSYPVLLKAINAEVLHSLTKAGTLGTASLGAYLVGTAAVSWASTRLDATVIVKAGLALSLTGLLLLRAASGFATLALGLAVAGLGSAAVWVPAPGIAAALVGPQQAGVAIGVVGSGIGLGILVVGPLTNAVRASAGTGAWRPVYGIEAVVAAAVLVLVVVFIRAGGGRAADRAPASRAPAGRAPLSALRNVSGWPWLVAAFTSFGAGYSLFFYFFITQLQDAGWSPSSTNLVSSLLGGASAVGGIVFGRLSDRVGRPTAMVAAFVILASAPMLTITTRLVPVLLGAIGYGLCVSGAPTAIGAHVADYLSGRAFGAAFGTLTFVFGAGQLAGPQVAGFVADRTGSFLPSFIASSLLALLGAWCSWRLRGAEAARFAAAGAPVAGD